MHLGLRQLLLGVFICLWLHTVLVKAWLIGIQLVAVVLGLLLAFIDHPVVLSHDTHGCFVLHIMRLGIQVREISAVESDDCCHGATVYHTVFSDATYGCHGVAVIYDVERIVFACDGTSSHSRYAPLVG